MIPSLLMGDLDLLQFSAMMWPIMMAFENLNSRLDLTSPARIDLASYVDLPLF